MLRQALKSLDKTLLSSPSSSFVGLTLALSLKDKDINEMVHLIVLSARGSSGCFENLPPRIAKAKASMSLILSCLETPSR